MSLLQRATSTAERLLFLERVDPTLRRVTRLGRVALHIGIQEHLAPRAAVPVARIAIENGLSIRTVHAIHAAESPDRPALVEAGRTRTYAETNREINRLAHALRDEVGVRRGDTIALAAENSGAYLIAWFAAMRLGVRVVHTSWRSRPQELRYVLGHSKARVVFASDASLDAVLAAKAMDPPLDVRVVSLGQHRDGTSAYEALVARARSSSPPKLEAKDAASDSVVYTSGTTGKPKGAVRDFARFGVIEGARLLERLPFRIGDRHLVVSPLYHSGAQAFAAINAALGSTIFVEPHFEARPALEIISREKIHSLFLVPTMLRRVLELPKDVHRATPTPELRAIVSGAAEFPDPLRRAAIERFGAKAIFDFYGATELGWVTLVDGTEMLTHKGSVGRALAGQEIAIFSPEGRRLGPGETGLVYVRNEQTMEGYLDDPAATSATRLGPWITVEDLGRLDTEGHLYLAGRARDMVKSGGVNLYPIEIEEVLLRHPSVRDVAVIGVPDPEWGERLVAVVVPREKGFDPADVERFAKESLASLKVPKEWHVVDELPRNPTGKVIKRELQARYAKPS